MNPTAQLVETLRGLAEALLHSGPAFAAALFAAGGVVLAVLWWAARRRAERAEAAAKASEPATRADLQGVELELARVRDALAQGSPVKVDDCCPAPAEPILWRCPYCLQGVGATGTDLDHIDQRHHLGACEASSLVRQLQHHHQQIVFLEKQLADLSACPYCDLRAKDRSGGGSALFAITHFGGCEKSPIAQENRQLRESRRLLEQELASHRKAQRRSAESRSG